MNPKIEEIEKNVDLIRLGDKLIYLVGTAHVSKSSVELAERYIKEIHPDSTAVELCESRYKSLQDPDRWKNTDIVSVIRAGRAYVLLAQLFLAGFQKKIGANLDVKPGAEMMRAIKIARETGSEIVLADRDIRTTLKRTWAALNLWSIVKISGTLLGSLFIGEDITDEEIEKLKSSDVLESMMKEFSDKVPEVKTALIDERDLYLAAKIQEAPGDKVVAVVGAGHVPGIKRALGREMDLTPLEVIPAPSPMKKIFSWAIPALIIGMIIYGFFASGSEVGVDMAKAWIYPNSIFAGLGALIALPHPLTLATAILIAPISSLNPFFAAGWAAGLVEAVVRKPRVGDLESIADDMGSLKGVWTNRVSKILLVIALTNLGSMVGTAIGIPLVASLL